MSSESGVLLIRNDGTIQLKGDSKILGEYHLKHRLLAKVKPDGSMGVFMIPEQGANKGKMFAVLPNGPSGKEGVGWERVVSKGSTYLRPVFKPMTDKKNSSSNTSMRAKSSQLSGEVVIDLCDDSDTVPSVEKTCSTTTTQSSQPTPVMLFTKDSAAKLNSSSIVVASTQASSQANNTNFHTSVTTSARSTPQTVDRGSTQVSVAKTTTTVSLTTQVTNSNSVAQNVSKTPQCSATDAYDRTTGNILKKLALNLNDRGRVIPNSDPSTTTSIMTLPKTSTVGLSVSQPLVTQASGLKPQTPALPLIGPIPVRPMQSILGSGQLPFNNANSNTGVKVLPLSNVPRVVGSQNMSTAQIQGITSAPQTSLNSLIGLPRVAFTSASTNNVPQLSSVGVFGNPPKAITTMANAHQHQTSVAVTVSKETPIQINSVFSLAPIDPIKPWLTNGKNMPLSEVEFWAEAINLKIPDDILSDTRLRKGCSTVLHRTTSHRPRKIRGCRFKDTQCNEACRKSFVRALMKNLTRKKDLKMKRRRIYASLCLEIRKKAKVKKIERSIKPKTQTVQRTPAVPTNVSLVTSNKSILQSATTVPTTQSNQTAPNEHRFLLVRMNGQNVLLPNANVNGNFINLSSVAMGTVGMNANVDPKATSGITGNVPNVSPRATVALTTSVPNVIRVTRSGVLNVGPTPSMGLASNFVPRASSLGPINTTRTLLGTRLSLSTADMMTSVRPNLPSTSLPAVLSLPQLGSYNSILTAAPVRNVMRAQTPTAVVTSSSIMNGGNIRTNIVLPPLSSTPHPPVRLSIPSSVATGQIGTMAQTAAPFPVSLRAVNTSGGVNGPYPVAVRMVPPSSSARPMIQSQLTFNNVRPGQPSAINSTLFTRPVTTTAAVSVIYKSPPTSLSSATPYVPSPTVEEPLSSNYAKSKVNKGIKYYFIPGGVKIKMEPKTTGYGDETKKHKKHKKHKDRKRSRSPSPGGDSGDRDSKRQKVAASAEAVPSESFLDDIARVTSETDIENISKSEMSADRIKQLREKLHENQRKLEEYLRQVDS
uniref:Mucin-3A-like isoform X2 n=1 Tax=Crassostrea virginica TaxID=6565 RepID=A0A8B8AR26_CRAVI|nr:mucin-3A-like isoform X2 [Crassostrea virginica]